MTKPTDDDLTRRYGEAGDRAFAEGAIRQGLDPLRVTDPLAIARAVGLIRRQLEAAGFAVDFGESDASLAAGPQGERSLDFGVTL